MTADVVWLLPLLATLTVATRRPRTQHPDRALHNVLWACFYIGCLSIAAACALTQWRPQ